MKKTLRTASMSISSNKRTHLLKIYPITTKFKIQSIECGLVHLARNTRPQRVFLFKCQHAFCIWSERTLNAVNSFHWTLLNGRIFTACFPSISKWGVFIHGNLYLNEILFRYNELKHLTILWSTQTAFQALNSTALAFLIISHDLLPMKKLCIYYY